MKPEHIEATEDNDIAVSFDAPATSKKYFGVQFLLEDELKPYIEREAINV